MGGAGDEVLQFGHVRRGFYGAKELVGVVGTAAHEPSVPLRSEQERGGQRLDVGAPSPEEGCRSIESASSGSTWVGFGGMGGWMRGFMTASVRWAVSRIRTAAWL